MRTPTRPFNDPFPDELPVQEHAVTDQSYPDGFILEIKFRFDPNQKPIFPRKTDHPRMKEFRHRPTFLGNSGIGIYHWPGNGNGKYLYEVQVTDVAAMAGANRNIQTQNRFVRLDYGENWDQKGPQAAVPGNVLTTEKTYLDPSQYNLFKEWMIDPMDQKGGRGGSADCVCAIVAGLPVSYFKDVYYEAGNQKFPRPDVAVSSPKPPGPNNENPLPISGDEDPLNMYYNHRADYVDGNHTTDVFQHYNHLNSGAWNTLRVCFLPARYDATGAKTKNAYLDTKVNQAESYGGGFSGEIKSGTRASRHNITQDPEPAVYGANGPKQGDMKIRLLGHWGSTVEYTGVTIYSVGSQE